MNQYMSTTSSDLTSTQRLNLSQAHFSSTYDLRTHHEASDQQHDYQLGPRPIEENEHQYLDLPNTSETIHVEDAHQHQLTDEIQPINNISNHLQKHYKQYLVNNSKNHEPRIPKPRYTNS